jgi:transmembrane sensor
MQEDLSDMAVQGPEKTREEASMWLARLGRGLRPEEVPALRAWLKDRVNRAVALDTARLWHSPDILAVLGELIPVGPEPMEPLSWKSYLPALTQATVATLLILWIISGATPRWHMSHWTHLQGSRVVSGRISSVGRYFTAVGERGELQLGDGTHVTLNTSTRMVVSFGPSLRNVSIPSGEASFHVAPDRNRPFMVIAGRRQFEALGTNFNVRVLTPDNVELTVTEGNVRVFYSPPADEDIPAVARLRDNMILDDTTIGALQTALLEPGLQFVRKIQLGEADMLLAWRQGLIYFQGAPLADALAEVDRYTTTQFVLADEKLRSVRIGGAFHTGDVDGLLHSLRQDFRIDSRRDAQGRVVLTALNLPPSS